MARTFGAERSAFRRLIVPKDIAVEASDQVKIPLANLCLRRQLSMSALSAVVYMLPDREMAALSHG
jgi:hypothetical protein